ncbi:MAG: hypothetical protein NE330_11315 [Lentisphaeraceae bacterium]|nr:hypothetical protein [Lentisphaeraceae bacterium]
MNKKILLPILALIIYAVIIWPKDDLKEKDVTPSEASRSLSDIKKPTNLRKPLRIVDPNFKPEVVKAPITPDEKKYYRTSSPEALAHAENERISIEKGPGQTPAVTKDQITESKQLQSAIEAVKDSKNFASRLTPLAKATSFEKKRFLSDRVYREEYLSTAEPARVYQTDDSSKFKIKRKTPYFQEVVQGESVFLSVEAEPNMPVSITSFDLGKFANHLTYQTVLADSSGTATFEFFGMPGTFNNTNILASSPTSIGQVKFVVYTKIKTENSN